MEYCFIVIGCEDFEDSPEVLRVFDNNDSASAYFEKLREEGEFYEVSVAKWALRK